MEQVELTPCDPDEPDVGILSCAEGRYCEADTASESGGFCVETQRDMQAEIIQQYCDNAYIQCDCSAFDLPSYTGQITCGYEVGCTTYQGQEACMNISIDLVSDPLAGTIAITYCTGITGAGTPYTNVCYYTGYEAGSPICDVGVDGTKCLSTSCTSGTCPNDPTGLLPATGFDCSNTADGQIVEPCQTDPAPFPVFSAVAEQLVSEIIDVPSFAPAILALVPTPAPAVTLPGPTVGEPAPAVALPEPTVGEPAPAVALPEPTVAEPAPSPVLPGPTVPEPGPTVSAPEPTASEPTPSATPPEPTGSEPAPTVPSPASTSGAGAMWLTATFAAGVAAALVWCM